MQFDRKDIRIISFILICSFSGASSALDERLLSLKAAYAFRFALFVNWPDKMSESVKFCFAGNETEIGIMKETLSGEHINNHPITVVNTREIDNLDTCHLLYITHDAVNTAELLTAIRNKPILSIGESPTFQQHAGMIYLFIRDDKLRFSINHDTVRKAGLTISAQLLNMAQKPDI